MKIRVLLAALLLTTGGALTVHGIVSSFFGPNGATWYSFLTAFVTFPISTMALVGAINKRAGITNVHSNELLGESDDFSNKTQELNRAVSLSQGDLASAAAGLLPGSFGRSD